MHCHHDEKFHLSENKHIFTHGSRRGFVTSLLVWLVWFASQRAADIQTVWESLSLSLFIDCVTHKWSLSQTDQRQQSYCFVFLSLLTGTLSVSHNPAQEPLVSIYLAWTHCMWLKVSCNAEGTLQSSPSIPSVCADSMTLLLCKTGISAPPPRRNTPKHAGTTEPLCGPEQASYQNTAGCWHTRATVHEERGFVWYVTHAWSSFFTYRSSIEH